MSEVTQIRRGLLPGEQIPAFSMLDLLLGNAYCDPVVPRKRSEPEKMTKREYNKMQSLEYAEKRKKYLPTIREMLEQGKSSSAIAERIVKSPTFVMRAIRANPDLLAMYQRVSIQQGALAMKLRRQERLIRYRKDIKQWLGDGRSLQYIANKIGCSKATARSYVSTLRGGGYV